MAAIRLKNKHNGYTMLPNRFIDEYMPLASGEYVKVYLYLLRQAGLSEPHVSVEDIAEHLMHTEKDIIRALKYWEKQGLLSVSFTENQECDSIELLFPEGGDLPKSGVGYTSSASKPAAAPGSTVKTSTRRDPGPGEGSDSPEDSSGLPAGTDGPDGHSSGCKQDLPAGSAEQRTGFDPVSPAHSQMPVEDSAFSGPDSPSKMERPAPPPRRAYTPQEIEEITERESLEEMIFVINSYMGRPLSQTELTSIIYFYDQLGFSIELIEYLFEYCISKNHKSIRYIEKTALNWAEDHISTPEEARERTAGYSEDCFAVLRAFGISGRNPVESEIRFVKLWRDDYHMSAELIADACSRTMAQIHTPSFEYADGILSGWKKAGVKSSADVKKLDEAFAAKKQQAGAGRPANRQNRGQSDPARVSAKDSGSRPSQTRFSNFEERNYSASDDADLEKLLLSRYRGQQTGT